MVVGDKNKDMQVPLRMDRVMDKYMGLIDFDIISGGVTKVVLSSERSKNLLWQLVAGNQLPQETGRVWVLGSDISHMTEYEVAGLFGRIGFVPGDGGLISNLNLWSNIFLPLAYHNIDITDNIEAEILSWCGQLGLGADKLADYLSQLPGTLTIVDKRLVGLIRAMVRAPWLIICDSVFDGIGMASRKGLAGLLTNEYDKIYRSWFC